MRRRPLETALFLVPATLRLSYGSAATNLALLEEKLAYDELLRQKVPLGGKFGDPDRDIAPVITFLVSDGARFVTGQNICINGGFYI